jgi:hypothetical protein
MARKAVGKRRKPQLRRQRPPLSRWRRFVQWLSRTHPVARALVGLVVPATAIVSTLLALGVMLPASASEQLSEGASASIGARTSTVALEVTAEVDEEVIAFTAHGMFDHELGRGRMTYNFGHIEGLEGAVGVEGRLDDGIAFLQVPRELLRRGDPRWMQVDLAGIDQLLRDLADAGRSPKATLTLSTFADVSLTDPSQALKELHRAGSVTWLREETIHQGRRKTNVYQGTLVLRDGQQRVQATAWIEDDDDHLIRRLVLTGDGQGGQIRAAIDFLEYGIPVNVEIPNDFVRASDVYARLIVPR